MKQLAKHGFGREVRQEAVVLCAKVAPPLVELVGLQEGDDRLRQVGVALVREDDRRLLDQHAHNVNDLGHVVAVLEGPDTRLDQDGREQQSEFECIEAVEARRAVAFVGIGLLGRRGAHRRQKVHNVLEQVAIRLVHTE